MSEFIITPTNTDFLEQIFKNPITGKWTIPILTFNTKYLNPYFGEIDYLNNDPKYHKRVINYFYFGLVEKWLYRDPAFRKLLKYFRVVKNGSEGTVQLSENIDPSPDENKISEADRKYVFKYIDKVFITKRFVEKALKKYVRTTRIKWYDLVYNKDIIKEYLAHRLKRLIVSTIRELQDNKNKNI